MGPADTRTSPGTRYDVWMANLGPIEYLSGQSVPSAGPGRCRSRPCANSWEMLLCWRPGAHPRTGRSLSGVRLRMRWSVSDRQATLFKVFIAPRLLGRHEALEFLEPVLDEDDLGRRSILSSLSGSRAISLWARRRLSPSTSVAHHAPTLSGIVSFRSGDGEAEGLVAEDSVRDGRSGTDMNCLGAGLLND